MNTPSKTASQEISICYNGGTCDETSTFSLLLSDGKALNTAGFITVGTDSTSIDVYPVAPEHIGTWTIMVTQSTVSGDNPSFAGIIITVDCTITDIPSPSPPSTPGFTLTYKIFDIPLEIDLSSISYP